MAYALAAGNTVVLPARERHDVRAPRVHPACGKWLVDTFTEAVSGPPLLQLAADRGETVPPCRVGVDKVAFTGSSATGPGFSPPVRPRSPGTDGAGRQGRPGGRRGRGRGRSGGGGALGRLRQRRSAVRGHRTGLRRGRRA
ncbi:hypothetical protein ACH4RG_00550 [Streptomyces sp. NPDC021019]|uniref:hypothetical protein n=1 Tax=Streptomyces sp. NPDC021019 TaxID=3365108 RepID=UPI0037AAC962